MIGEEAHMDEENKFLFDEKKQMQENIVLKEATCPSCGAKIKLYPGIISYVCEYCNTILFFENEEIKASNEKSVIVPFPTTLEEGKIYFSVGNKDSNDEIGWYKVEYLSEEEFTKQRQKNYLAKFYVWGMVRYVTENSFYNKFFLRVLDSKINLDKEKTLIAEEDEWQIKLYYLEDVEDEWFFEELYSTNEVNRKWFFIQEKWEQTIEWFSGWIPFDIVWVKKSKYLNLVWPGPKNYLVEKYGAGKVIFGAGL